MNTAAHSDIGMMVGVSTGKDGTHDIDRMPLGTARYLLAANQFRQAHGAEGALFVGNRREMAKKTEAGIRRRMNRIRNLARGLTPEMAVLFEEDIPAELRERIERELPGLGLGDEAFADMEHGDYKKWQTIVVGGTLLRNGYSRRVKYGVETMHTGAARGERQYDALLPAAWGIEPHYGPVDRDARGAWATPYLLHQKEADLRVCIPLRENGIGAELAKVRPGIREITLATWEATADVILGRRGAEVLNDPASLAAEPLLPGHLDEVHDKPRLDDAQGRIEEAIKKLIGYMDV